MPRNAGPSLRRIATLCPYRNLNLLPQPPIQDKHSSILGVEYEYRRHFPNQSHHRGIHRSPWSLRPGTASSGGQRVSGSRQYRF